MEDENAVILTRAQFETLLLALGMATGAAVQAENTELAHSIVRLTNIINHSNPDWVPYAIKD
jgi:hypothetical protein